MLGDGPGGGDPEDHVERDGDGGDQQGQFDRGARIGLDHRFAPRAQSGPERLDEHHAERNHDHHRHEDQCDADQRGPGKAAFVERGAAAHAPRFRCHS